MTFTYSTALSTSRDKVRFLIDDTDPQNQQFSDEEIAGLLTIYGTANLAAAAAADRLASRFAMRPDISIDGASFGYADKAQAMRDLAASLRQPGAAGAGGLGMPFAGGVSLAEIESAETDTDRAANSGFTHRPFNSGETE